MEKIYLVCGHTSGQNGEREDEVTIAFKNRDNAGHYLDEIRDECRKDTDISILIEHYSRDVSYSVVFVDKYKCRKSEVWTVKKLELAD